MAGDPNPLFWSGAYWATQINPQYADTLEMQRLNRGVQLQHDPSMTGLLAEVAKLRQLLVDSALMASYPAMLLPRPRDDTADAIGLTIRASERMLPMKVDPSAVFASTPTEPKPVGWEAHGAQSFDGWPEKFNDIALEAERRIEEDFKRLGLEGQKLANAVAKMQHAPNGMPPLFIPELD